VISLDTNILIYAYDPQDERRRDIAAHHLFRLLELRMPIAGQCLSEFLNVAHRKGRFPPSSAREVVELLALESEILEPSLQDRVTASRLAETHKIQFYDAQPIATLSRAGVKTLFSEDLKDGETYLGLKILSPFNPANSDQIGAAFA
jgi:predicted nucleic acid-binding protein